MDELRMAVSDPLVFVERYSAVRLRAYQRGVLRAVADAVWAGAGGSFAVMFPRQRGKNELQAHLEAYLLFVFSATGGDLVKVSPTLRPQAHNSMRRLRGVLNANALTRGRWRKENDYIFSLGQARILFLSGAPVSNIVGATASVLLEVDEAQSVGIAKYDREIAPMAASTNAVRVFWGTAWTADTLLSRELREAREGRAEGRVFQVSADDVGREVPAYAQFVAGQVERLGRNHPMVRTQYFCEEIDAEGGMFPPERLALMLGAHPRLDAPQPGRLYCLLLDVAGEDEDPPCASDGGMSAQEGKRDCTALTGVEVDPAAGPLPDAPLYRVVQRRAWLGQKHTRLLGEILALAELWKARRVVVDATGVGAGLASFLERALPGRVERFVFSTASKSRLGWDFLALVDAGRFKDHAPPDDLQRLFMRQAALCRYQTLPGPARTLRWGVPDGMRAPLNGQPAHDDVLISAALCCCLDGLPLGGGAGPALIPAADPLMDMETRF